MAVFALLGFFVDSALLSVYCLLFSVLVALLELPSLLQGSQQLRDLVTWLRMKSWAENPMLRGIVYLLVTLGAFIVAMVASGFSVAMIGLLCPLERGIFYLSVPYCSGSVGGDERGVVYDHLESSFTSITPTSEYLDSLAAEDDIFTLPRADPNMDHISIPQSNADDSQLSDYSSTPAPVIPTQSLPRIDVAPASPASSR